MLPILVETDQPRSSPPRLPGFNCALRLGFVIGKYNRGAGLWQIRTDARFLFVHFAGIYGSSSLVETLAVAAFAAKRYPRSKPGQPDLEIREQKRETRTLQDEHGEEIWIGFVAGARRAFARTRIAFGFDLCTAKLGGQPRSCIHGSARAAPPLQP